MIRRLLLDTHALLWALSAPRRLPSQVVASLRDPESDVYVSAVSTWEIAIKSALGKLDADLVAIVEGFREADFEELPVTVAHTVVPSTRSWPYHDQSLLTYRHTPSLVHTRLAQLLYPQPGATPPQACPVRTPLLCVDMAAVSPPRFSPPPQLPRGAGRPPQLLSFSEGMHRQAHRS